MVKVYRVASALKIREKSEKMRKDQNSRGTVREFERKEENWGKGREF